MPILPFTSFQSAFHIVRYSDLAFTRSVFSMSESGAASDSYWSGVVGSGSTFFFSFFFFLRLISFPAHFLCGVNGLQARAHPGKGTSEGKTEQERACGWQWDILQRYAQLRQVGVVGLPCLSSPHFHLDLYRAHVQIQDYRSHFFLLIKKGENMRLSSLVKCKIIKRVHFESDVWSAKIDAINKIAPSRNWKIGAKKLHFAHV